MDGEHCTPKHYRECAAKLFKDVRADQHWCEGGILQGEGLDEWDKMLKRPGFRPFSKMFYVAEKDTFEVVSDSFINGTNAIRERGIDLRYGWDPSRESLLGIFALGPQASWARGFKDAEGREGVHGGVFHTVMDEVTAEFAKYSKTGITVTHSVPNIVLRKPLYVGDWAAVEAKLKKREGVRIHVECKIHRGTLVIAQSEFVLCDVKELQNYML